MVIPIHNEEAESVFARIEAMLESVAETGSRAAFEFFVLSDTTEADIWLREEVCWSALRRDKRELPALYYRRRPNKFRRKSGNIADFCERWGRRYRYMIVLDADSVMDGRTMNELVSRMEHAPRLGILQAPSLPAMRHSLYARVQQFAASVYGPPIFAGLAYCFQDHGNFWGHNAIVRMTAFIDYCGLPGLPGRPPFGGPILSHDFVEAGLMQRAGYDVRLAWDLLLGSYEQCPVSLASAAARDRRWCQGNLQHLRLIFSPSFSKQTRAHFAIGVRFYLASTMWGLFVALYAAVYLRAASASTALGSRAPVGVEALFVTTLSFLFVAKLMAVGLVLADETRRRTHGGPRSVLMSACLEIFVSVLVAPILMVTHIVCLSSVLFGISVEWSSSDRDESDISLDRRDPSSRLAERARPPDRDVGVDGDARDLLVALTDLGRPELRRSARGSAGESRVGRLVARARAPDDPARNRGVTHSRPGRGAHDRGSRRSLRTFGDRLRKFIRDPWFNTLHVALLQATDARARPRHIVEPLVLRTLELGASALSPEDALAVLSDPWAMQTLHEENRRCGRWSTKCGRDDGSLPDGVLFRGPWPRSSRRGRSPSDFAGSLRSRQKPRAGVRLGPGSEPPLSGQVLGHGSYRTFSASNVPDHPICSQWSASTSPSTSPHFCDSTGTMPSFEPIVFDR